MQRDTVWCSYCGQYLLEGVARQEHLEDEHPIEAARERAERRDHLVRRARYAEEQRRRRDSGSLKPARTTGPRQFGPY